MLENQLPLEIVTPSHQTLDNFCWHGNEVLQNQLQLSLKQQGERFYYIWGKPGVGKSHLLQALSHVQAGQAIYLPLTQLHEYGTGILEDLDLLNIICLDQIEAISGSPSLEEALFHLYNRIRDNQSTTLIISGQHPVNQLPIELPDLSSRIAWGLSFHLQELDEAHKLMVLEQQAHAKGFELPPQVSKYLLTHCARDLHQLSTIIETLDKASLAAQRKLTVPFVKDILSL